MSVKGTYEAGPDCRVCGYKRINVVHDDTVTRARNIEVWAMPTSGMNGQDYYTWADIKYHPFDATSQPEPKRSDYERGYQAGYHAAARRKETVSR